MRALILTLALGLLGGCIAYNDPCQPLVPNPDERVAFVRKGTEIWLDQPNARQANNALGQAAADAFVWVFRDSDSPVAFGVTNGGSIRAEGLCVTRNIIPEGPLSNGVLHEILLFENLVTAVDLSEQEVWELFEHSAQGLVPLGAPIGAPPGAFLQVSGDVQQEVDCALPALGRVVSLTIGGQVVQKPARPLFQVKYRLALPEFLLGGGDGYSMLLGKGADTARNPQQAQRFGGIDSNIAATYLRQSAFNVSVEQGLVVDPSRTKLTHCAVPPRPPE